MMRLEPASELKIIAQFVNITLHLRLQGVLSGFIFPDE